MIRVPPATALLLTAALPGVAHAQDRADRRSAGWGVRLLERFVRDFRPVPQKD